MQVGETSVVNVDCSRAGPGELSLEAALDSPPTSPTGSRPGTGNTGAALIQKSLHTINHKQVHRWLNMCCFVAPDLDYLRDHLTVRKSQTTLKQQLTF